jgi:hypothetical protein
VTKNNAFQTEDQYIFIHDAILESCLSGLTEVSARNLHSHLQRLLMDPMSPDQPTGMELEFKVGSIFLQFQIILSNLKMKIFIFTQKCIQKI